MPCHCRSVSARQVTVCSSPTLTLQDRLQASESSFLQQQPRQARVGQQEEASPESPSAAAETPAAQDNGWDEQAGWDFQDVPLDSPKSSSRQPSTSQKGSPDSSATHAAHGDSKSHAKQMASLQQANDALTKRLKHVETVCMAVFCASAVCVTLHKQLYVHQQCVQVTVPIQTCNADKWPALHASRTVKIEGVPTCDMHIPHTPLQSCLCCCKLLPK